MNSYQKCYSSVIVRLIKYDNKDQQICHQTNWEKKPLTKIIIMKQNKQKKGCFQKQEITIWRGQGTANGCEGLFYLKFCFACLKLKDHCRKILK